MEIGILLFIAGAGVGWLASCLFCYVSNGKTVHEHDHSHALGF